MPPSCQKDVDKNLFFFFLTHFEDTYHPDADCTSDSLHLRECKRWFVFKKSDYLRISHKAAISVPTMFLRVGHKQFVQGVREANQWCLGDQSSVLLFAMHDKVLLFKLSAMKHKFGINFGDTVICPAGTICPSSSAANSRCLFGLGRVLSFISFRFKYYSGFLVLQNKSTVQPKNWITAHTGMKSEAQILSCYSFLYWFVHYLWSFTTVYNKYSLVLRCAVLCIVLYLEMVDFTRMQLSVTVQTQRIEFKFTWKESWNIGLALCQVTHERPYRTHDVMTPQKPGLLLVMLLWIRLSFWFHKNQKATWQTPF